MYAPAARHAAAVAYTPSLMCDMAEIGRYSEPGYNFLSLVSCRASPWMMDVTVMIMI
jgi:hypothetical protein